MPIAVQCGGCQASYNVADSLAGRSAVCPRCKTSIAVPALTVAPPALPTPGPGASLVKALTAEHDWRFKRYWTGSLVRILWVIGFAVIIFYPLFELAQGEAFGSAGFVAVVGSIIALVALRITLESVSVLFDVAQTLKEIRNDIRSKM